MTTIRKHDKNYKTAVQHNLRFYKSKHPCKQGHEAVRYTSTGSCVECQKYHSYRWLLKNMSKHNKYNAASVKNRQQGIMKGTDSVNNRNLL